MARANSVPSAAALGLTEGWVVQRTPYALLFGEREGPWATRRWLVSAAKSAALALPG